MFWTLSAAPSELVPSAVPLPLGTAWRKYEAEFQGQNWVDMTRAHAEIPIFVVSFYMWMVFYLPGLLKGTQPLKLKSLLAAWNLLLAIFSLLGSIRTVPVLYFYLRKKGFQYTVCTDPKDWFLDGPVGLFVGLFIFSKIPELLDTAFLVVQQKRVIFLHWFHHCTVMLYCWHAYHNRVAPGLWFAAMNYFVHSIMYLYYFAMAANMSYIATPFAPLITTVQILQMAVGSFVTFQSALTHAAKGDDGCHVDPANYKLGLAMYCSYFVLFSVLFGNKYFGEKTKVKPGQLSKKEEVCGVEVSRVDTTGRFQDFAKKPS